MVPYTHLVIVTIKKCYLKNKIKQFSESYITSLTKQITQILYLKGYFNLIFGSSNASKIWNNPANRLLVGPMCNKQRIKSFVV